VKNNYLLPNCVVLLAAVFMTRKAYDWAQVTLPIARNAENLISERDKERDDTHDQEYREEATNAKRRFNDMRDGGISGEEE